MIHPHDARDEKRSWWTRAGWVAQFLIAALAACLVVAMIPTRVRLAPAPEPAVEVHYLGHASFLLEFPTGLTVLTDYGESRAYGLDSPVFGLGDVVPDVVTRSHDHPDHAGGSLPTGIDTVLTGEAPFEAAGVRITAIPTFESSLETPDNMSFVMEYDDLRILHLGDCQALIIHAFDDGIPERIQALYPDRYDLVLLPIGFTRDILDEAAAFVTLLDARQVVPMHYWQPTDRDAFLDRMRDQRDRTGRPYRVRIEPGPVLRLRPGDPGPASRQRIAGPPSPDPLVIGLTPAPASGP